MHASSLYLRVTSFHDSFSSQSCKCHHLCAVRLQNLTQLGLSMRSVKHLNLLLLLANGERSSIRETKLGKYGQFTNFKLNNWIYLGKLSFSPEQRCHAKLDSKLIWIRHSWIVRWLKIKWKRRCQLKVLLLLSILCIEQRLDKVSASWDRTRA